MNVYQAALKRRSIRKFRQDKISNETLLKYIDAARVAPSASNMQPIKYVIVNKEENVKEFFSYMNWAGYIRPEGDPKPGEEPTAYIVILADTSVRKTGYELDIGAAAQTIMLCAQEDGTGTCWLGAIDRESIKKKLNLSDDIVISTVIALGYPAENPQIESEAGSIKYYKDQNGNLHVPKRKMEDILYKTI